VQAVQKSFTGSWRFSILWKKSHDLHPCPHPNSRQADAGEFFGGELQ
jgi:hypothetical protein